MYVYVYQDWLITSMMLRLHSLRLRQQRKQDSLTGKLNKNIVGEEIAIMNVMIVVTLTREVGWNGRQSISVQRFIVGLGPGHEPCHVVCVFEGGQA